MKTFIELCNSQFLLGESTHYGKVLGKRIENDKLVVTFEEYPWIKNAKEIYFEYLMGNLVES